MKHLLKSVAGRNAETKCGLTVPAGDTCTAWWTDVTCPECLALMGGR